MRNATFKLQDSLEVIQIERNRLTEAVNSPEFKHNIRNWGWMTGWLEKTNEEHAQTYFETDCSFCGKHTRWLVNIDPDCDEYACSIRVCKKCLSAMTKLLHNINT